MKPHEHLGTATTPDGSTLTLHRHDGDYSLRIDGVPLMSTRQSMSEQRLAEVACAGVARIEGPRVLIGGLGLGVTLTSALKLLPHDATVLVVEIVRDVIAWNQNPDYALAGPALADPRVELRCGDVAHILRDPDNSFDAIMLDVDNGAEAMTTSGNYQLYAGTGIRAAKAALRPGGRLVYWSATEDQAFANTLEQAGLVVEVLKVPTHPSSKRVNVLFSARRVSKR